MTRKTDGISGSFDVSSSALLSVDLGIEFEDVRSICASSGARNLCHRNGVSDKPGNVTATFQRIFCKDCNKNELRSAIDLM